jgi:hypothetical protein
LTGELNPFYDPVYWDRNIINAANSYQMDKLKTIEKENPAAPRDLLVAAQRAVIFFVRVCASAWHMSCVVRILTLHADK